MSRGLAVFAVLGLALFFSQQAFACRCAQRPLAEYFKAADAVVFGTVQSSVEAGDQRELVFTIRENAFKGELRQGESAGFLSTLDTASCGIDPVPDTVYVLFGVADPAAGDQLRIDTCSGTRPLISNTAGGAGGFLDVPERFVPSQLAALQGLELLREYSANMPDPENPTNSTLVGLLDATGTWRGGSVVRRTGLRSPGDRPSR